MVRDLRPRRGLRGANRRRADDDDSAKALFYMPRLCAPERTGWAAGQRERSEIPRSRLRRMIRNVRILSASANQLRVACN